ncbi:hypothetical protein CTAYLR_009485 [Chrysophaeum taylorii]|uniref:Uncharacterized protein n=1 Tax=Chrysophaeum taylorii TaxID=2483200 RepID=A0AAD7UJB9_9STRA|nr:hypothetical protein CTAYLR_009485 [Chrysophaeum taylorii]
MIKLLLLLLLLLLVATARAWKISKIVWQTVGEGKRQEKRFIEAHRRMVAANPNWAFEVVDDARMERMMAEEVGNVARAFMSINPRLGAARADLWRYSVLFVRGGVYADADVCIVEPLESWLRPDDECVALFEPTPFPYHDTGRVYAHDPTLSQDALAVYRRLGREGLWDEPPPSVGILDLNVAQWFLAAAPGHPAMGAARTRAASLLERWVDDNETAHLTTRMKVLYLTGPVVWNQAVRSVGGVRLLGICQAGCMSWPPWLYEGNYSRFRIDRLLLKFHCVHASLQERKASYIRADRSLPIKVPPPPPPPPP